MLLTPSRSKVSKFFEKRNLVFEIDYPSYLAWGQSVVVRPRKNPSSGIKQTVLMLEQYPTSENALLASLQYYVDHELPKGIVKSNLVFGFREKGQACKCDFRFSSYSARICIAGVTTACSYGGELSFKAMA